MRVNIVVRIGDMHANMIGGTIEIIVGVEVGVGVLAVIVLTAIVM